jgi:signal transduction histidine kinase
MTERSAITTEAMSVEPLNNRIKQLERLLEVSRNLSAMLELEPLLRSITEAAADITYSQEASILLYEEETDDLAFVASPWYKHESMKQIRVPLEGSIAGQVFIHAEPILVRDAQRDDRLYRAVDERTDFETRCLLAVPMMFKGKAIGVLTAVNKLSSLHFSEEDVTILETLASQAAIAIKNAGLLKQAQDAYEELAEIDRMKTDFIAITSHELRTPLGLILGHATFLNEMVPDDLSAQMEVIVRSSMRLKEIVEDLSKVNNFQSGQSRVRRREVNVNLLLQDVAATFKEQAAAKSMLLKTNLPEKKLTVEGDAEKIGIAVSHLIKNAISFTDEGGAIEVATEELPGYVKISVIDSGVGIPRKDLTRVFERFFQVESHMTRRHGGMGLGLSVAKMMVEMHGGRIGVESVEGEGSNFTILFPTSHAQLSAAQRVFKGS